MRKGTFILMLATSSLLAAACSDDGGSGNSETSESGTAETGSSDSNSTETGTTDSTTTDTTTGDGDGDTTTGDGDGDGDATTGDGDGDGDATTGDGDGDATTGDGDGDPPDPCGALLQATVRDFQVSHPDMEAFLGVDPGIVEAALGNDGKPVYAGNPSTPTTTNAQNFNQWYNDVDGVNQTFDVPIQLVEGQPGVYGYANNAFFPIDDLGWGNEGNVHNYHFTLELHTQFQYNGGEVFGFEGDDDLWVFVNGQLAIDLGGVHGPLAGQVDMDAQAQQLGLQIGQYYDIDFFFAERHTTQSNFAITTTISCFNPQ